MKIQSPIVLLLPSQKVKVSVQDPQIENQNFEEKSRNG